MKRAILSFIVIVWAAACAAGEPRMASTDEPDSDVAGYEARIAELNSEMERVLPGLETETLQMEREGGTASDDCGVAADLRDRICDLGQRICEIADREPSTSDTALKCQRATTACSDARRRVAGACAGR